MMKAGSHYMLPFYFQDSNDFSNIQLTPEQQRQLELIEKMPLLKETRPGEPQPGLMPGESADPDIGMLYSGICVLVLWS